MLPPSPSSTAVARSTLEAKINCNFSHRSRSSVHMSPLASLSSIKYNFPFVSLLSHSSSEMKRIAFLATFFSFFLSYCTFVDLILCGVTNCSLTVLVSVSLSFVNQREWNGSLNDRGKEAQNITLDDVHIIFFLSLLPQHFSILLNEKSSHGNLLLQLYYLDCSHSIDSVDYQSHLVKQKRRRRQWK